MKPFVFLANCFLATLNIYSQGTLVFDNYLQHPVIGIDAPIYDIDGTKLEGDEAWVQLYVARIAEGSFIPVDEPAIHFLTGAQAGYVNTGLDSMRTVSSIPPGLNALAQVRAWKGAPAWEEAVIRGESNIVPVELGGGGGVPLGPGFLVGLQSFSLIPEPNSFYSLSFGIVFLLWWRVRPQASRKTRVDES